jgi:hypothetical protein
MDAESTLGDMLPDRPMRGLPGSTKEVFVFRRDVVECARQLREARTFYVNPTGPSAWES